MKETVSRAELHARFAAGLERAAPPGSVFVFEIDRKEAGSDGCNWYPLASMGSWRGDLAANLSAFRQVRERLSALYDLEPAEAPAGVSAEG